MKGQSMKKIKRPKCRRCHKPLKRKSESFIGRAESYKGNMICYRIKKKRVGEYDHNSPYENYRDKRGDLRERPTVFIPKVPEEYTYDYTLWDGVSYQYWRGKEFCGKLCAAMWAYDRN
tara:strand:+ start:116 stop:469 length:354 start_codon:yes stop_codon:yes gene_type:complete